jgi:hypothetical protein
MWVAVPALIHEGATTAVINLILITFLFEYLPKIYHAVCSLRRLQISGKIWWGIALNLMAYFVAAHVSIQNISSSNSFLTSKLLLFQVIQSFLNSIIWGIIT